jgi:protein involved in polysaccharide export with SLBB domain
MKRRSHRLGTAVLCWAFLATCAACTGCGLSHEAVHTSDPDVPHELKRVSHLPYVIESPDVLLIDAIRLVPRPPYRIEPLDLISIIPTPKIPYRIAPFDLLEVQVTNTLPERPIAGFYAVEPTGSVNLRFNYGTVPVTGLTLEEAKAAVDKHLKLKLKPPYEVSVAVSESRLSQQLRGEYLVNLEGRITLPGYGPIPVAGLTLEETQALIERQMARPLGIQSFPLDITVGLAQSRGTQQIKGEHLVRPDGTVQLGAYGSVSVDGLTINEAKDAVEAHLSNYLLNPKISLDVAGYNSKVYYIVLDGGGVGEQVVRLPSTGKETVLDAIGLIGGLPAVGSKRHIWLARPTPSETGCVQTLPVDWIGITQRGLTATNYQVLPGDRIYVKAASIITADIWLQRMISPLERILGIALLGKSTEATFEHTTGGTGGTGGIGTGR